MNNDAPNFRGLKALFINCSIKKDKSKSHTQLLIDKTVSIMTAQGVEVEQLYALDHRIAFGMIKDGADEGLDDDCPMIQQKVMEADILVIGTPIWLGVKSSIATQVIERLYAYSGDTEWKGEKLPAPAGLDNDFTNRNATFMNWNLMHAAKMLKDNNGFPAVGNTGADWQHVTNAKSQNPEYR